MKSNQYNVVQKGPLYKNYQSAERKMEMYNREIKDIKEQGERKGLDSRTINEQIRDHAKIHNPEDHKRILSLMQGFDHNDEKKLKAKYINLKVKAEQRGLSKEEKKDIKSREIANLRALAKKNGISKEKEIQWFIEGMLDQDL